MIAVLLRLLLAWALVAGLFAALFVVAYGLLSAACWLLGIVRGRLLDRQGRAR